MPCGSKHVSVVLTVRNDPDGCALVLDSLARQTRPADEIIVVDGGSTDTTPAVIGRAMRSNPRLRLIEAPRTNIARGRNLGIAAAAGPIIATTDAGCRPSSDWLAKLIQPFEEDDAVEFVAGFYQIEPHSLLEEVVGLATMRGQLEPVSPETFNPSARSVAYTKSLWARAGGLPEMVCFSEDTLFDQRVRRLRATWRFVSDAVVYWRPRSSLRAVARQFHHYGTGRGHTQIGAPDFAYSLRNLLALLAAGGAILVTRWAAVVAALLFLYFYVWTFHHKAVRIAKETRRWRAYPLCLVVMWVVLLSNLAGYLVGSWQRWKDQDRYRHGVEAYLAADSGVSPGAKRAAGFSLRGGG